MNDTDQLGTDYFEAMQKEGVEMSQIGEIWAKCTTLINRARNERKADSMLPLYGAKITAMRIGVCERTTYNLAKRHRRKKLQESAKACATS